MYEYLCLHISPFLIPSHLPLALSHTSFDPLSNEWSLNYELFLQDPFHLIPLPRLSSLIHPASMEGRDHKDVHDCWYYYDRVVGVTYICVECPSVWWRCLLMVWGFLPYHSIPYPALLPFTLLSVAVCCCTRPLPAFPLPKLMSIQTDLQMSHKKALHSNTCTFTHTRTNTHSHFHTLHSQILKCWCENLNILITTSSWIWIQLLLSPKIVTIILRPR